MFCPFVFHVSGFVYLFPLHFWNLSGHKGFLISAFAVKWPASLFTLSNFRILLVSVLYCFIYRVSNSGIFGSRFFPQQIINATRTWRIFPSAQKLKINLPLNHSFLTLPSVLFISYFYFNGVLFYSERCLPFTFNLCICRPRGFYCMMAVLFPGSNNHFDRV